MSAARQGAGRRTGRRRRRVAQHRPVPRRVFTPCLASRIACPPSWLPGLGISGSRPGIPGRRRRGPLSPCETKQAFSWRLAGTVDAFLKRSPTRHYCHDDSCTQATERQFAISRDGREFSQCGVPGVLPSSPPRPAGAVNDSDINGSAGLIPSKRDTIYHRISGAQGKKNRGRNEMFPLPCRSNGRTRAWFPLCPPSNDPGTNSALILHAEEVPTGITGRKNDPDAARSRLRPPGREGRGHDIMSIATGFPP